MLILKPTQSLQVVLAAPVATTECSIFVSWCDDDESTGLASDSAVAATDGTTPVEVVPAPTDTKRQIKAFTFANSDSAPVVVTLQVDVSGTPTPLPTISLPAGYSIILLGDELGVYDSSGAKITGTTATAVWGSITGTFTDQADAKAYIDAGDAAVLDGNWTSGNNTYLTGYEAWWQAAGAPADISAHIIGKGTGGFAFGPVPDGTATGGDLRGKNAVDLQARRSAAGSVASGDYGAIGGGYDNTASGAYSTAAGGYSNVASGDRSSVLGGFQNTAGGKHSVAAGYKNTADGDYSCVPGGYNLSDAGYANVSMFGHDDTATIADQHRISHGNGGYFKPVAVSGIPTPAAGFVAFDSGTSRWSWNDGANWVYGAAALSPTAVKTSNFTFAANDFSPVNVSGGSVTGALPTAPVNGTRIGAKIVAWLFGNTFSLSCGGSDVFNVAGGSTTLTISMMNQAVSLQYFSGVWYVVSTDLPASNTAMTGSTQMQSMTLRTDLAAGYTLAHPDKEALVSYNVQVASPVGAANWTKLAELIVGNTGQTSLRFRATLAVDNNTNTPGAVSGVFEGWIRASAGNVLTGSTFYWVGVGNISSSFYFRVYRDVDGSSRNRMTVYIYDASGASVKTYSGKIELLAGHSDDIINVWQAGVTPTTTDPAGTMTEVVRQTAVGAVVTPNARTYANTLGTVTNPQCTTIAATDSSTTISYTNADQGQTKRLTAATAIAVTIDGGGFTPGDFIEIIAEGAGQITVAAGSGMTQHCGGTGKSRALYSPLFIRFITATIYELAGDMSAT